MLGFKMHVRFLVCVYLMKFPLSMHSVEMSIRDHGTLRLDAMQVIARAHRMGALRPVHVEVFILRDSVEDAILKRRAVWSAQQISLDGDYDEGVCAM